MDQLAGMLPTVVEHFGWVLCALNLQKFCIFSCIFMLNCSKSEKNVSAPICVLHKITSHENECHAFSVHLMTTVEN